MAALLIYGLELLIIGGHASGQLKAAGDIVQDAQIQMVHFLCASRAIAVQLGQPVIFINHALHNVDNPVVNIAVALLSQGEFGDFVHLALAGHKVNEMITLELLPCVLAECQIELDNDALERIIVPLSGWAGQTRLNTGCEVGGQPI